MISTDEINVVYSCDDNYAMHAGISIISLLQNNENININIFIINNKIKSDNIKKLRSVAELSNNVKLHFVDFAPHIYKLNLNMEWKISETAYARLFLTSLLPETIEKVLYLDCDTIINGSLIELWNTNIQNYMIAGVQDTVNVKTKEAILISSEQKYVNSGVLLINLKKWRENKAENYLLNFINKFNGRVTHHDQGVINGCYGKNCLFLPLKYNFMTIHYFFNRKQLLKYFSEEAEYYSWKEINDAKINPIIYHFTPSFTSRPWIKGCAHPRKDLYLKYLAMSPWNDYKLMKNNTKWYVRLIEWRYRNLPF